VWLPFAVLLAVFFVSQLFAVALFAIVSSADPGISASDPPDGFTIGATFLLEATLVAGACAALTASQGRIRPEDFGLRRVDVRRALRVGAAVYGVFWLTAGVLLAIFGEPAEQEIVERLRGQDAVSALVGFALLTCVLAPLAEEFFFRGFMFTVLARRLGPVPGALVVGAAFGLIHAPAPWLSLLVLGCFGVALCALYWRTGSIIPCMALHALHNSISFAATKALPWWGFVGLIGASVVVVLAVASAVSSRPSPAPAASPAAGRGGWRSRSWPGHRRRQGRQHGARRCHEGPHRRGR
jgi:membrane protease YdiL (CAAX protease family)